MHTSWVLKESAVLHILELPRNIFMSVSHCAQFLLSLVCSVVFGFVSILDIFGSGLPSNATLV
jgi:hypothetical protein